MWQHHRCGVVNRYGLAARARWVLTLLLMFGMGLVEPRVGAVLQAQQATTLSTNYLPIVSNAPPFFSTSYYIESANPTFFSKLGCVAAVEFGQRRISDGVVILFFGQPAYQETLGYGTLLLDGKHSFASVVQIQEAALSWIDGYINGYDDGIFRCDPPIGTHPHMTLALSTSNQKLSIQIPVASSATGAVIDPDPDMASHGKAWASLINYLAIEVPKRDPQQRLSVAGANDIEPAWNSAQQTRLWVGGYLALAKNRYYHVGSCDGCPERAADAPASGPYAFGWTAADLWAVSAQGSTQVLPQMYNELGTQARQWATLAQVTASLGRINFAGALTQYGACEDQHDPCAELKNRPGLGWQQFSQALKEQRISTQLTWSTDVRWDFDEQPFNRGGNQ